ncbi:hypothetical protein [Blastococcus sp. CCUG 61487]|uniref:hypothetical protein n=1 Tax=Blastococcus sp. CCUG 61487 TaxID=1840703 RepID=UPI0010C0A22D|nr:hypothetical protein [Blastococcus sp. CCUG 61487]TKJ25220.1 hypothetical protein A6V29_04145 [Blastococcus sp. CCUG 61487]
MTGPQQELLAEPPPAVLAVLDDLRGFTQLVERVGGADRIGTRKPTDVRGLFVWVRSAGGFPLNAARGAWSRTVQIEVGAAAPVAQELPELAVERVAGLIAVHFASKRRAQVFQGASWRARPLDGPFDMTDTSRGADAPVFKQGVRLDVRMHAPV